MQRTPNAEIAHWIAISVGLAATAWAVALFASLPAIPLVTAAPAIAALIVSGRKGAFGSFGFARAEPGLLPLALFGPIVVNMAGLLLVIRLGLASWKTVPVAGPGPAGMAALLLGGAVFVAFMEETAFRGFLLPRLLRFGVVKAVLLSGLAHGLWRLPLMFAIAIPTASHSASVISLVTLAFMLGGAFHGLLWLISGSIWPAVLVHLVGILGWAAITGLTTANVPWAIDYSAAVIIFGLLILNALALLMLRPDHEASILSTV